MRCQGGEGRLGHCRMSLGLLVDLIVLVCIVYVFLVYSFG